jgi:hypothetical protein
VSQDSTTSEPRQSHSGFFEEGNWRPPRTSVALGVLLAIGMAGVLIGASGLAAAGIAALAGLSAGGILLFVTASRHQLLKRLCASVLLFFCGLLILGCAALAFQSVRSDVLTMRGSAAILRQSHVIGTLLLVGGVALALGGAAVTGRDSIHPRHYKSAVTFGILTVSLPLFTLAGLATIEVASPIFDVNELAATAGDILFGHTGSGPIDYIGLVVTWILALISVTLVRVGLKYLPIAELAPSPRRKRLKIRLNRAQSALYKFRLAIFIVFFIVLFVESLRRNTPIGLLNGYLQFLSVLGTASLLRGVLLGGIAFGVGGVTFGVATKRFARLNPRQTVLRLIPFVTGLFLVVVALQFSSEIVTLAITGPMAGYRSTIEPLLLQYRPATLVVAVLVVVGLTPSGLYFGLLLADYALLPERADGAAVLSVGLFIAAVGALLNGMSALIGFVGIASSFIVWDINTNAVSLGREIGRHTPTRQSELVHTGGSLLVATLGIVVAMAGLVLAEAISAPPASIAPVAAVISIVGLFTLIFGLRSR